MVKKVLALSFVTVLLSSFLVVPAVATEYTGGGTFYAKFDGSQKTISGAMPLKNQSFPSTTSGSTVSDIFCATSSGDYFSGTVSVYLSFYGGSNTAPVSTDMNAVSFYATYATDMSTSVQYTDSFSVSYYSPYGSGYSYPATGVMMRGRFVGTEGEPVRFLRLNAGGTVYSGTDVNVELYNFSAVYTETTAEAEQLEEIADVITNQYNISVQYYGNVMTELNNIYQELGTMTGLQEEAIKQFEDWNAVTEVPSSVTDKTQEADKLLAGLDELEKPDPVTIIPDLKVDTTEASQVFDPIFENALILQMLLMTLGFGMVSYVLFGKK